MTFREILAEGERQLAAAEVPEAKLCAWYLFACCFHMERSYFYLHEDKEAPAEAVCAYEAALVKRALRIPLEYITHETEFMGLSFYVDENVLIPRQDTECLVEEVLKVSEGKDILDLCTGSGCIGISLAALGKCRSVTLADISPEALAVAEHNARRHGVEVILRQSDLFSSLAQRYDTIVSNPPYIPSEELSHLMPEVRDYEPHLALDGKEDGLFFYKSIILKSCDFLTEEGWLFFEIGYDQGEAVSCLMQEAGFTEVTIKKDLAGLDRVVSGRRMEA